MTRSCTFALNNVKIPCGIPQIKICIKDCYNKMQVNSHKFSTCIHVCHLGFILHLYVKTEWHSSFTDHILSYMCSNVKSLIFRTARITQYYCAAFYWALAWMPMFVWGQSLKDQYMPGWSLSASKEL